MLRPVSNTSQPHALTGAGRRPILSHEGTVAPCRPLLHAASSHTPGESSGHAPASQQDRRTSWLIKPPACPWDLPSYTCTQGIKGNPMLGSGWGAALPVLCQQQIKTRCRGAKDTYFPAPQTLRVCDFTDTEG